MIKVEVKNDILKGTEIRITCNVKMQDETTILTEEVYKLVKDFEKEIPDIWCNVIERVMTDALGGEEE